jgi:hypothetical protein
MQEMQVALGITFPTLKKRLEELGIHQELKVCWKKKRFTMLVGLIEKYYKQASNTAELSTLIGAECQIGPQVIRRVLRKMGREVQVYSQMAKNKQLK